MDGAGDTVPPTCCCIPLGHPTTTTVAPLWLRPPATSASSGMLSHSHLGRAASSSGCHKGKASGKVSSTARRLRVRARGQSQGAASAHSGRQHLTHQKREPRAAQHSGHGTLDRMHVGLPVPGWLAAAAAHQGHSRPSTLTAPGTTTPTLHLGTILVQHLHLGQCQHQRTKLEAPMPALLMPVAPPPPGQASAVALPPGAPLNAHGLGT